MNASDIKLFEAEVHDIDVSETGGAPTGREIIDGRSNNLFPDIPELSRVLGEVSIRLAYLGADTPDRNVFRGARAFVGKVPGDPRVSVVLFQPEFFDRRTDMQRTIEGYLSRGPRWAGYLFDNHIKGQRAITLLQREGAELPPVGKTLLIVANEGLATEAEQYVRVTDVSSVVRSFTIADGSTTRTFKRAVVTCEISDPLERDFLGVEATDLDAGAPFNGKAVVRDTIVADAARYYGASPLTAPAGVGDLRVSVASVRSALVPAAQTEIPIVDARPNQSIAGALAAGGGGELTITTAANFDEDTALYVGGSVLPGSLTMSGAASLYDRAGVLLDASGAQVGTVDYVNGVLTPAAGRSYPGTKTIRYRLGADPGTASLSMSVAVTAGSRGSAWAFVLNPLPAAASLRVSFMSGGRWYVLSDAGDGALRGADSAFGAGQLNRSTGSAVVTLGALPDVGSRIILQWAPTTTVQGGSGASRAYFEINLGRPVAPGTLALGWEIAGAAKAATDAAGLLSGDGIGSVDYNVGRIRLSPNVLPAPGTQITVAVSDAASSGSGPLALTDAGSTLTGTLAPGVSQGSVAITATLDYTWPAELYNAPAFHEYQIVDQAGALKIVQGDGTLSAAVGTVNYSTGAIAINKAVPALVSYPIQTYGIEYVQAGAEMRPTHVAKAYVSQSAAATVRAAGASARYTSGVGAGGSAVYDCGALFVPDVSRLEAPDSWQRMATVGEGYVSGAFMARIGQNRLVNRAYGQQIYMNPPVDTTDWAAPVGSLIGAVARLTTWPAGESSAVQIDAASGTYGGLTVDRCVFRFPTAPMRPGSITVSAERLDGTLINATGDASGVVDTADMVGVVDYATGVVDVVFKTAEGSDTSPWALQLTALGYAGAGKVKVGHVKADSIRVAGVAYTYLPLPANIIGLNAVRLPSDGQVFVFRPGDVVVIHHTASTAPANVSVGQTISVGRGRLARLRVIGSDGVAIASGWTANLDAGTATFDNVTGYAQPVTLEHMVKDEVLASEVLISGEIVLSRQLTHDFPSGSVVSSALLVGNLSARVPLVFDQQSWTNVWSDDLIGNGVVASLNLISHPIIVTNDGAVTERWAILFSNTTTFRLIGEHVGVIAEGNVANDFSPLNPFTGQPYFTLPAAAWGGGWSTGNVVRINTVGALHPIGCARTVQQGDATLADDSFTLVVMGDRDNP